MWQQGKEKGHTSVMHKTRIIKEQLLQVEVEWHTAARESLATQIEWLARTSIFVCNIGSPSFRLVYLPDGAQVRPFALARRAVPHLLCVAAAVSCLSVTCGSTAQRGRAGIQICL
jgi:hypothetical protein